MDIIASVQNIIDTARGLTDKSFDIIFETLRRCAEPYLEELCRKNRRRNIITAALNSLTLVPAVLCAVFTGYLQSKALIVLSLLSLLLLARTIFNGLRFLFTVVRPNFEILSFSLPCLLKTFAERHSVEKAIKAAIAMAVRIYYDRKLPASVKKIHETVSRIDIIKSREEIEQKAANDFYPLVKQYLLQGLLLSTLLWTVMYGLFLGLIKTVIFTSALDTPVWRIVFWVFQSGVR
jgi:hypothetical protein